MKLSRRHADQLLAATAPDRPAARPREPRSRRKPDLRPREKAIQKEIVAWLRWRCPDVWVVRINSGGARIKGQFVRFNDTAGTPDLLLCVAGRFVGIEVKRPGEKPSAVQLACHAAIRAAGGVVIVADSVTDVEAALRTIRRDETGGDRGGYDERPGAA